MSEMTRVGSVSGYLARPSGKGPWPALVVIQEWWGLDQQTRSIADWFAGVGVGDEVFREDHELIPATNYTNFTKKQKLVQFVKFVADVFAARGVA